MLDLQYNFNQDIRKHVINGDMLINRLPNQEELKKYDKQERHDAISDNTGIGVHKTLIVRI